MPRLDSWIKTRVMTFIKPRHHKKLTTRDITISAPIHTSTHNWSPVMRCSPLPRHNTAPQPCSRWSVSAEDLLLGSHSSQNSSRTPSLTHSRDSSNSSGITIVVHSPPSTPPPGDFCPQELPLLTRAMWDEVSLYQSPLPSPLPPPPAPKYAEPVLFSETSSPTSYFKSAFELDLDLKDLMQPDHVFNETEGTDELRCSYMPPQPQQQAEILLPRRMSVPHNAVRLVPGPWETHRVKTY